MLPPSPLQTPYRAAIALSLALVWAVLALAGLRSGLGDGGMFITNVALFGLAAIWLPFAASPPAPGDTPAATPMSAIAMILAPILPVIGLLAGPSAAVCCLLACATAWIRHRRGISQAAPGPRAMLRLGAVSIPLAVLLIVSGASWRVFIPEALTLGIGQADSYFHIAIAQVIARFGIPSTGGDGLLLQHYHFGSHFVAAGLAEAGSAPVALAYVYWGLILLKVQLLWSLAWGNLVLARPNPAPATLPLLLAYLWVFVLLGPLESESFMLAMAVFAGAVPLFCRVFTQPDTARARDLATLVMAAFICATAKVSVGYFCAIALLWTLWRVRAHRGRALFVAVGLAGLGAYTVLLVMPFEQSLAASGIGILLGSYAQYAAPITLISYALPSLVLWACLHDLRLSAAPHGRAEGTTNSTTIGVNMSFVRDEPALHMLRRIAGDGLMQMHLLCIGACLLVLALVPIGNGMAYFSYVLMFLPALVAPGWLHAAHGTAREVRVVVFGAAAITFCYLVVAFSFNLATTFSTIARTAQQQTATALRDAVEGAGLGRRVIARSWRESRTLLGHVKRQIEQTPWRAVLRQVGEAHQASPLQVHAPPAADAFWLRLRQGQNNPYWCLQAHLMVPAELGIPMLLGIAPLQYESGCSPIAGLYGFGKHQDAHRTRDLSDRQLCEIARSRGVGAVFVLNGISATPANRVLRCTGAAAP